ncbi:MAG: SusC/RagA family TonB-linked outer membrane protein [Tannerella sp.]|jgi:TonB-linked SusC/RagA family outer membrane protein|nr:SusC/RagA family TonB-linked outer membrane protein [Tannerella sp.]
MVNGTVAGFFLSSQGTTAEGTGAMQVRGPTSLKASNEPLVVVDGVIFQGSIQDINPNDIESIDILKDASSAAVFGARSAAGVLIVTTKRGNQGKPTIEVSAKIGFAGVTKHIKPADPEQYLIYKRDYRNRMNPNAPSNYYTNPNELPSDISIQQWLDYDASHTGDAMRTWLNRLNVTPIEQNNYLNGVVTDWYDDIYKNGLRQDYNFSLYGGNENVNYFWSNGWVKNQGISVGDVYEVFRSRFNIDAKITNFLKVGFNAQFSADDKSSDRVNLTAAIRMSPFTTQYDENGKEIMYPNDDTLVDNPFLYYLHRDRLNKTQAFFGTFMATLTLPYGFSYNLAFANRFSWTKDYYFDPIVTPNGLSNSGYGQRINQSVYDYSIDNILKWNQVYAGIHKFDFTFLFNVEKFQSWSDTQTNSKFSPSDALSFHALQGGVNPSITNNDEYSTGNALMARLNYTLQEKYLMTLSYRRDGYSAFGLNNPYANFTSAALGWNIAEEKFFLKDLFSQLKLRASWGTNGNREIGRYDALARLGTTLYFYGNTSSVGVFTNTMANQDLKWERTAALNFGIDFSLLKSRVFGSIDYYDMTTNDLLLNRALPVLIGYSSVTSNLGELKNKGFELTLNTINVREKNIEWNSMFTFSFNRNKITHLYGDMVNVLDANGNVIGQKEADDPTNGWFIGQSIDRIWDYEILGIYQSNEADEAAKFGKQPGDIKLRDVNGDGLLVPEDDKVFQGHTTPQFRFGLRNDIRFLRDFELSFFIRADIGAYGINNEYKHNTSGGQYERSNWYAFPYWTPENPDNEWARLSSNFSSPAFNVYVNRSFARLQELSLSYELPAKYIKKYNVGRVRLFINANNLVTLTKWNFWDPETLSTPMPRNTTFGVNISL